MQKLIKKTNGKKTESVGLLMVAFQILMTCNPDLINSNTEKIINIIISSGIITTLGHRIWRNKKIVRQYIEKQFNRLRRD